MMRKDITALQMMDSYKSVKITFEDIIMASFETGYISAEDIDVVAKYVERLVRTAPKEDA